MVAILMEDSTVNAPSSQPMPEAPVTAPTPTEPAPMPSHASHHRGWQVISAILAVAVVGLIVHPLNPQMTKIVDPKSAAQSFVDMVNKVYAPTVANAKVSSVDETHGLYHISFTADINGQTDTPQEVYLSTDGQLFMPQTIAVADVLAQYQAQQASGANTAPSTGSGSGANTDTNAAANTATNTAPANSAPSTGSGSTTTK